MLSLRRKPLETYYLPFAFSSAIDIAPLSFQPFAVLCAFRVFESGSNKSLAPVDIRGLFPFRGGTIQAYIDELLEFGFLVKPEYGHYVVTEAGEYYLRGIETQLSRLINQSKLARWSPIKSLDDPRRKYLRRANRRGVKKY